MTKQSYAVIGLGRFGTSIISKLYEAGQEVMGIDINNELVDDIKSSVTHAVALDSTDEESLKSVGIRSKYINCHAFKRNRCKTGNCKSSQ
jgi:trk system potassium uptake protein TrkA